MIRFPSHIGATTDADQSEAEFARQIVAARRGAGFDSELSPATADMLFNRSQPQLEHEGDFGIAFPSTSSERLRVHALLANPLPACGDLWLATSRPLLSCASASRFSDGRRRENANGFGVVLTGLFSFDDLTGFWLAS